MLDADTLVQAVRELTEAPQDPIVEGAMIKQWCDERGIDYGEGESWGNRAFYAADNDEARGEHRLQKFKRPGNRANLPVGWCLREIEHLVRARSWARDNDWLEVPWDPISERWDWERAREPSTTA